MIILKNIIIVGKFRFSVSFPGGVLFFWKNKIRNRKHKNAAIQSTVRQAAFIFPSILPKIGCTTMKTKWHWKITIFNRTYIFKWWGFPWHVSLRGCIFWWTPIPPGGRFSKKSLPRNFKNLESFLGPLNLRFKHPGPPPEEVCGDSPKTYLKKNSKEVFGCLVLGVFCCMFRLVGWSIEKRTS